MSASEGAVHVIHFTDRTLQEVNKVDYAVERRKSLHARYYFGILFFIMNLVAWFFRDYGQNVLPWIHYIKACGNEGDDCFHSLGVLRVSLGCFIFFLVMFVTTVKTRKLCEGRNSWHSRWWELKAVLLLLSMALPFFIPSQFVQIYGEIARIGAGIFLLLQLVSVIHFIMWWNNYWTADEETKERCSLGLVMSTLFYVCAICGIVYMYASYASKSSCSLNIFFITWTSILLAVMMVISLNSKINRGLLSSGIMASYIVFLCWCAIRSEPATIRCDTKNQETRNGSWITILGFLIAIFAIVLAAFSTGIDSKCFQFSKNKVENEDDIPYNYGFFHMVFSLGAMYFAMLFISWDLNNSARKWSIDVGWISTWVKVLNGETLCNNGENSCKVVVKNKSLTSSTGSCSSELTEQAKTVKGYSSLPTRKATVFKCSKSDEKENEPFSQIQDKKVSNISSKLSGSGVDMMKERFAKLLLGEDMSGSGKGVSTALAISNAITNLCGTVFGQLWRLEPVPCEKKEMWQREMDWLLCVGDHIVELMPSWQTFPDGSKLEIMTCRPRSDIFINLPALRKLDNMLLEILDSCTAMEFWYVDQGIVAPDVEGSASFRKRNQRQEEKWWLPVPRVPPAGLSENSRKKLNHTRECASQILKAAMSINSIALADMEVPESYLESLPKNGKTCLGDFIYRYITSDQFSQECLLDCIDISNEHVALEIANRLEAAIFVWHRRSHSRPPLYPIRSTTKSSWDIVKDFIVDGDKRELLAERAENILLSLKQRFPGLSQTTLDSTKIQCNKDVGKSILESYSRVLESMAFNIVARIDDLLYVDDLTKHSDRFPLAPMVNNMVSGESGEVRNTNGRSMLQDHKRHQKKVSQQLLVSVSDTQHNKTKFGTPSCSPVSLISPVKGEIITPFIRNKNDMIKPQRRGFGVKRVLSNYLGAEMKAAKVFSNSITHEVSSSNSSCYRTEEQERKREICVMKSKTK